MLCYPGHCQHPGTIQNGRILQVGIPHGSSALVQEGNAIVFHCEQGYRRVGPPRAVCRNGQWAPEEKPECQELGGVHPRDLLRAWTERMSQDEPKRP